MNEEDGITKSPQYTRTADFDTVFERLMQGETFTDANADASTKMVINALINGISEPNGLGLSALPTSPFRDNLRVVQRKLGVPSDGIMGPQTWLAIITGGAVKITSEQVRQRRKAAKAISDRILKNKKTIEDILTYFQNHPDASRPGTTVAELGELIRQGQANTARPGLGGGALIQPPIIPFNIPKVEEVPLRGAEVNVAPINFGTVPVKSPR